MPYIMNSISCPTCLLSRIHTGVLWSVTQVLTGWNNVSSVMVCLIHLVCMPLTISNHLRLCPPTLQCHSNAHCVSSHNHTTPAARLNSDQCLISLDLVPMSWSAAYLSFSPYPAFACCIFIH